MDWWLSSTQLVAQNYHCLLGIIICTSPTRVSSANLSPCPWAGSRLSTSEEVDW
jgi:hypothetical protein